MSRINLIELIKSNQKLDNWRDLFNQSIDEFKDIEHILNTDFYGKILVPKFEDLFRGFELTSPENVKVIIFGQDPYPTFSDGLPNATGLAFSIRGDILTPSLINIYTEIDREFKCDIRKYKFENNIPKGDLSNWANQGVLLLNTSLTNFKNNKKVFPGIWLGFIKRVTDFIEKYNQNCVYMLWGKHAIDLEDDLKITSEAIFKSSHPSGHSAYKTVEDYPAFIGSNQFKKCNKFLKKNGFTPINWCT